MILGGWPALVKKTIDLFGATVGLIILAPFFLVIGIIIKLTSTGPVFFKQMRTGKDGRNFMVYKFRSMKTGAEQEKSNLLHLNEARRPLFKIKDDPRLTRIGKFLRRTSIDELPQLVNVFLGQMSLVGPRSLPADEVKTEDELQKKRLKVTPGMTGLWQIRGRSLLPFEEMVKLDIYYIENWSLWLDIKILLKTVWAVVGGRGAY